MIVRRNAEKQLDVKVYLSWLIRLITVKLLNPEAAQDSVNYLGIIVTRLLVQLQERLLFQFSCQFFSRAKRHVQKVQLVKSRAILKIILLNHVGVYARSSRKIKVARESVLMLMAGAEPTRKHVSLNTMSITQYTMLLSQ